MLAKESVDVLDAHMAYSEVGTGEPIVLLHGNPMHGFLWYALVPRGKRRLDAPRLQCRRRSNNGVGHNITAGGVSTSRSK